MFSPSRFLPRTEKTLKYDKQPPCYPMKGSRDFHPQRERLLLRGRIDEVEKNYIKRHVLMKRWPRHIIVIDKRTYISPEAAKTPMSFYYKEMGKMADIVG